MNTRMVRFKTTLLKFSEQGEKTGWTYAMITSKLADKIKPGIKRSFRVKGKMDEFSFKGVSLLPIGGGDFILPVNATMRKAIKKIHGASVVLELAEDAAPVKISQALLDCIAEDPSSKKYFESLPGSHKLYFSKWVEEARTDQTKTRRLAAVMKAFERKLNFAEMLKLYRAHSSDSTMY